MRKKYIYLILLFLYAALISFGLYHHEPWRDEAHAWVHAREASLSQIIDDIQYEGVPILYYFIMVPFAKLGFPYETMKVVHGSLAIAGVAVLLFFGELPFVLKILFTFSYFLAFEYGVIARTYILTVILFFTIAKFYPKRFEKPLHYGVIVGLLFQTSLHSLGAAAALMGLYAYELIKEKMMTYKRIVGLIIMVVIASFTLFMFLRGSAVQSIAPISPYTDIVYEQVMRSSIVPIFSQYKPFIFELLPLDYFIPIFFYVLIISIIFMVSKNKSILFLAIAQLGWILYINIFVHPAFLRHRGLILISLIFILWIANKTIVFTTTYNKIAKTIFVTILGFLLFLSWPYTFYIYHQEFKHNFSGAKDMASYIRTEGLDKNIIATYVSSFTESVLAYFPRKRFWYAEFGDFGYRNVSDLRYHAVFYGSNMSPEEAAAKALAAFPNDADLLFLMSLQLHEPEINGFNLIHSSSATPFWEQPTENLWLYSRQ